MRHAWTYDLPILGLVLLVEEDGRIIALDPAQKRAAPVPAHLKDAVRKQTPLLRAAAEQLEEYAAGRRKDFDLPLAPRGTAFQQKVWQALTRIPYGETRSYKQIAEAVGCAKGFRAVGLANNRNPIAVVIPCHRVIGADGKLVGYGGGLPLKQALLRLEGCTL